MSPAEALAASVMELSVADRLRFAADVLDDAKAEGGNTAKVRIAHSAALGAVNSIGAALAAVDLRKLRAGAAADKVPT